MDGTLRDGADIPRLRYMYYEIKVPILTHVSSNNKTLSNSSAVVAMLVGRGSLG